MLLPTIVKVANFTIAGMLSTVNQITFHKQKGVLDIYTIVPYLYSILQQL